MSVIAAKDDNLNQWQDAALRTLDRRTDPGVAFDVYQRTTETCTAELSLLRLRTREDLLAAMKNPPESEGAMCVAIDDNGGNVIASARVAAILDQQLFSGEDVLFASAERSHADIDIPDFVRLNDYVEAEKFKPRLKNLIHLLHKYFGDECNDLILGFFNCFLWETSGKAAFTPDDIKEADVENKRNTVAKILQEIKAEPSLSEESIIQWAFGDKFIHRLAKEYKTPADQLAKIKELLTTNDSFRKKLLHALHSFILTSPRIMSAAFVRWGWKTIADIDEVTDFEWWQFVQKQHEEIAAKAAAGDPQMIKITSSAPGRQVAEEREAHIKAFFEKNPHSPSTEEIKKLREAIGCNRLRAEFETIRGEHNPRSFDEKQREIIARVSGAVSRYVIGQGSDGDDEAEPAWQEGFPVNFRDTKNATCFTGPWLIAMMLMECGISYNDIFYAAVNQSHNGIIGGHGGLVVTTRLRHNVFIDHGLNFACRDLPTASLSTKEEAELANDLLRGRIREAITVLFAHPEVDRIHPHMQLMPLSSGITSGHLYHVGLSFMDDDDYDRAQYAFELAHTFNRQDPDIIYHLGLIMLRRNNIDEAEFFFNQALKLFPNHLSSTFGLGECCVRRGDHVSSKGYFAKVAASPLKLWQNEELKKAAGRYAQMDDAQLIQAFTPLPDAPAQE